ncbi:hypothetical protein [Streptomyces sp. NPDC005989]|uniref:hypothetical protein n=1 Tax=Streptomyces sp. NPDC005989 TaxID=3156727 RepID=UPI0033F6E799
MDRAIIRQDCTEAIDLVFTSLTDRVEPEDGQVDRLRTALTGHVRELVRAVGKDVADATPGRPHEAVARGLALSERALAQPVRGDVVDLVALPQVARILLLMYEESTLFGAVPKQAALPGDAWGSADAG